MKKTINQTLFVLAMAIAVAGCNSSTGVNDEEEEPGTIIGKWKLVTYLYPFGNTSKDCSRYNVVYEFQTNNVLLVSREINNEYGHEAGEHPYNHICYFVHMCAQKPCTRKFDI